MGMTAMAGAKGRAKVGMRFLLMIMPLSGMEMHFCTACFLRFIGTGKYRQAQKKDS